MGVTWSTSACWRVAVLKTLAAALSQVAGKSKDTVVIINADAQASHQSVINVMDAARRAGLTQLTFATQGQHDGAATSAP
jgi:biopolymer transport protein ExbD